MSQVALFLLFGCLCVADSADSTMILGISPGYYVKNLTYYNINTCSFGQVVGRIPSNFSHGSNSADFMSSCVDRQQNILYAGVETWEDNIMSAAFAGFDIETGDLLSYTKITDDLKTNYRGTGVSTDGTIVILSVSYCNLYRLDPQAGQIQSIYFDRDFAPSYMAFNPTGDIAYIYGVLTSGNNKYYVLRGVDVHYGLLNDVLLNVPYDPNSLFLVQIVWADSLGMVVGLGVINRKLNVVSIDPKSGNITYMIPQIQESAFAMGTQAWDDEEQAYYFIVDGDDGYNLVAFSVPTNSVQKVTVFDYQTTLPQSFQVLHSSTNSFVRKEKIVGEQ